MRKRIVSWLLAACVCAGSLGAPMGGARAADVPGVSAEATSGGEGLEGPGEMPATGSDSVNAGSGEGLLLPGNSEMDTEEASSEEQAAASAEMGASEALMLKAASSSLRKVDYVARAKGNMVYMREPKSCSIASIASVEAYVNGGGITDAKQESVYNEVKRKNNNSLEAYWPNLGYVKISDTSYWTIYDKLVSTNAPVIVHRPGHYSLVVGFEDKNGNSSPEENEFLVMEVQKYECIYGGYGYIKDWKENYDFGSKIPLDEWRTYNYSTVYNKNIPNPDAKIDQLIYRTKGMSLTSLSGGGGIAPEGCLDEIRGGEGTVYVRGWALDRDIPNEPLRVHVYIGGPAGSRPGVADSREIYANQYRPDVGAHGFEATLNIDMVGNQPVYIYAISDNNPEIGRGTVTIKPRNVPRVTDIKMERISSSELKVSCVVESQSPIQKVMFPVWTTANGQDDLKKPWRDNYIGTREGNTNTYYYLVKDSDHNYERGEYNIHIYAQDVNGNENPEEKRTYSFDNTFQPVASSDSGNKYEVYDDLLTWQEAKKKCEALGGHLVTITSAQEQETVQKMLAGAGSRGGYFIGGYTDTRNKASVWVTGEGFDYTNWEPGEPNSDLGGLEYVYEIHKNGRWNDVKDNQVGCGFICEYEQVKSQTVWVYFYSEGGSTIKDQMLKKGGYASRPKDPTRAGYRFTGWYLDGSLYDFSRPVTKSIILKAGWEEEKKADNPIALKSISLNEASLRLKAGDTGTLQVFYNPADTTVNRTVKWSSADEKIASVGIDGTVTALAVGTTTITAEVEGKKTSCQVTVWNAEGIWIQPIGDQTYTGKAIRPAVAVYDGDVLLEEKKDYTVSYKNNVRASGILGANGTPTPMPTITVTARGNYSDKALTTFRIQPKDISGSDFTVDDLAVKYNAKKVQKLIPAVIWNGQKLTNTRDFSVSYPDEATGGAYKEAGRYQIKVTGKGNFTGERLVTLTITKESLITSASVAKIPNQAYASGSAITPDITVKVGKVPLEKGRDYEVAFVNNCEVGTATAVITGKGTYSGIRRANFKIVGGSLKNLTIKGVTPKYHYTGQAIEQEGYQLSVVENRQTLQLEEGTDYTVSYQKNVTPGTATILFTGINRYKGNTAKKTFRIEAYNISKDPDSKIEMDVAGSVPYAKGGGKAGVSVFFDGEPLTEGVDYTLRYKNHTAVASFSKSGALPTVTITGKGRFAGSLSQPYEVTAQDLSELSIQTPDKVFTGKKGDFKSVAVIRDLDGKTLSAGRDYDKTLIYTYRDGTTLQDGTVRVAGEAVGSKDIVPANTWIQVQAVAKAKGSYTGELTGSYRIIPVDIKGAKVTVKAKAYTGREIELKKEEIKVEIRVKGKTQTLKPEDFEIVAGSYKNNIKKGSASVTIKAVSDNYGGTKAINFTITPKKIY